jgi:hypothetical protein
MVDLADIQAAYYMVAATGVLVAAIFYVVNLRETSKNRKITFTTSFMQQFYSKENSRRFIDLRQMKWSNIDEYMKKYDSEVNPENFADRWSFLGMLDVLGYQYKTGLVDIYTLYELGWSPILMMWIKFKPIIMMYKKSDYGEDTYANFERLATEMWRIKNMKDPTWKEHDGGGFKSEDIKQTFS